jgi:hypothetical protein
MRSMEKDINLISKLLYECKNKLKIYLYKITNKSIEVVVGFIDAF